MFLTDRRHKPLFLLQERPWDVLTVFQRVSNPTSTGHGCMAVTDGVTDSKLILGS